MKVELIEKYNMSVGTVLMIRAEDVLKVGDKINADNEEYIIKGFMFSNNSHEDSLISVIV